MTLTKNDLLFKRNNDGKLISKEVTLETLPDKPTITIRPLTRGQLAEVHAKATSSDEKIRASADNYIIKYGLAIEPALTDEDLELMIPQKATAIVTAIIAISVGLTQNEVNSKAKDKILTEADEFLKKN